MNKRVKIIASCVAGVAVIGVGIWLIAAHAASSTSSVEAESGTKSGSLKILADTSASNGQAIQFTAGSTTSPTPTGDAGAFPPKAGTIYWGFSEGPDAPLLNSGVNPGIDREYFQSGQATAMAAYARVAANRGSVPMVSIKNPGTWQDVANGKYDAWVNDIINQLSTIDGPVLWTIHHEPENDVNGTTQTDATFKAMCIRVTKMNDAKGDKQLFFGPTLMSGKYNPIATPNDSVRLKATDWVSANSGDFFAFDGYNHYDPTSGKKWRSVNDTFSYMVADLRAIDSSKPIVIAEYGVRDYAGDPTKAPAWITEAYNYGLTNHIAAMSYFSSSQNVNDGGSTWELTGARLTEWLRLLKLPTSVHTK
jgi:hypothetical protein